MKSWLMLIVAILAEVAGTTLLRLSEGFTRPWITGVMVVCYIGSFYLLSRAVERLELGVAYAVWAGVGTALIAVIGMLWFNETLTVTKAICFALIIVGSVGLNLSGHPPQPAVAKDVSADR